MDGMNSFKSRVKALIGEHEVAAQNEYGEADTGTVMVIGDDGCREALSIVEEADATIDSLRRAHKISKSLNKDLCHYIDIHLPVIFDPDDDRIVIGNKYQFYDWYGHKNPWIGILERVEKGTVVPFSTDNNHRHFTFIREVEE